jgi:hypothetical protein
MSEQDNFDAAVKRMGVPPSGSILDDDNPAQGVKIARRNTAILTAGVVLIATSVHAGAGVISPAGLARSDNSSVIFVQENRKPDTLTQRVKRSWKDLVGYQFDVACPILIPLSHSTCIETGRNREDAREKCSSKNPFCYVTEISRR